MRHNLVLDLDQELEVLFAIIVLLEKSREYNKNVYVRFIDFQKAFDKVQHYKLIEKRYRIIKKYLLQPNSIVHVDDMKTDEDELGAEDESQILVFLCP